MSGPFGAGALNFFSGAAEFYSHTIDQSARFNDNDSAYLSKLWGSAGNRQTFTWSFWIKRSNTGGRQDFISFQQDVPIIFNNDTFRVFLFGADRLITNAVFRDVSAWYHFVLTVDSTNATSGDRIKLYVNGERWTDFSTESYPSLNANANIYTVGLNQYICRQYGGSAYIDGYVAEVHQLDGIAADADQFGETKNGIWIPKNYTGSYGTNGFKLVFQDSASLGDDTSGNGNDFTSSGLASTDQMPDSPTNNFATWNTLKNGANVTLSEGNLKAVTSATVAQSAVGTIGVSSGKWYWEVRNEGGSLSYTGIVDEGHAPSTYIGSSSTGNGYAYNTSGQKVGPTSGTAATYGATYTTGDIIGVALDMDAGTIDFYKNNVSQGEAFSGLTGTWFPAVSGNGVAGKGGFANFGQDSTFAGATTAGGNADANGIGDFKYSVPSGYLALCAANLPAPGIDPAADEAPTDYFNTVLYSGNSSTQAITGVGFQPDWVWIKKRSADKNHAWYDSVRGVQKHLSSSTTDTEATYTDRLSSFDADGFTVEDNDHVNSTGSTYAAWNWKAGGTAVSNTDGSITSSVSASPESGFSIVTYTGTGANATVGHGLGKAPDMIILKKRTNDTQAWQVYHSGNTSEPETEKLTLNTTAATVDDNTTWNDTAPTSTVFSIGTGSGTNEDTDTYVAYCFAEIDGFSKFGTYTGNALTDGSFVYTGFRPAFVMCKRTDSTNNWPMFDNKRDVDNVVEHILFANVFDDELSPFDRMDFLSNGFKLRDTGSGVNNAGTFVYMAFAEQPFKYSNAR